jgi:curved DNA-binding protein CbpA
VRAAYLALVGKFHPDRHHGNPLEELAAERLAQINHAYEILSDPVRRTQYDSSNIAQGGVATGWGRPRQIKVITLVVAALLLIRFFPLVLRFLEALLGIIFRSLAGLRGTPFVAAGALLLAFALVVVLVRRRRKK